jgi:hypothetical protein
VRMTFLRFIDISGLHGCGRPGPSDKRSWKTQGYRLTNDQKFPARDARPRGPRVLG